MASAVINLPSRYDSEVRPTSLSRTLPAEPSCRELRSRDAFVAQFQRLRDETFPEVERIEKMLTRVAIAYGLEYCHLDILAESFLALSRDVRQQLLETRKSVLQDDRESNALREAQRSTVASLERFRDVITSDLTCKEATPIYRRLIAELVKLETYLSRSLKIA